MNLLTAMSIAAVVLGVVTIAYAYIFGKVGQRDTGADTFSLPLQDSQTALDEAIAPLEAEYAGQTGLKLLTSNHDAFAVRYESARLAGRSLDLQYYYWKADLTGRLLGWALIQAADRGVRVRLLIDDINSGGFDSTYLALDSHRNIDVRLFNPSRSRSSSFRRGIELMAKYFTATRRMHNKCWIADGRLAIIGGRNIADEYFDASKYSNFRDIDLLAVGQAVRGAETVFDSYWNSDAALPVRSLHKIRRPKLAKLTAKLGGHLETQLVQTFLRLCEPPLRKLGCFKELNGLHWMSTVEVAADPPEKAKSKRRAEWLSLRIDALLQSAKSEIRVTSPYFIPGRAGLETLRRQAQDGLHIAILTNSLAATDVLAVHGAYAKYRRGLAEAGIDLYELQAEDRRRRTSLFGSKTASLHTKALVVDGRWGFVGSFNLDPRSVSINTEMGILFDDAGLSAELRRLFERQTASDLSFKVTLSGGRLAWEQMENGAPKLQFSEPGSPFRRIFMAWLIGLLPIESQL